MGCPRAYTGPSVSFEKAEVIKQRAEAFLLYKTVEAPIELEVVSDSEFEHWYRRLGPSCQACSWWF